MEEVKDQVTTEEVVKETVENTPEEPIEVELEENTVEHTTSVEPVYNGNSPWVKISQLDVESTEVMEFLGIGCLVKVTIWTPDESSVSVAMHFVPGVKLNEDQTGLIVD